MILLFLDDERNFEDVTWIDYQETYTKILTVRNYKDFVDACKELINTGSDFHVSLDHDIQDFQKTNYSKVKEFTGYDCIKALCLLVQELATDNFYYDITDKVYFHTKNPIGLENMKSYYLNFLKHMGSNLEGRNAI